MVFEEHPVRRKDGPLRRVYLPSRLARELLVTGRRPGRLCCRTPQSKWYCEHHRITEGALALAWRGALDFLRRHPCGAVKALGAGEVEVGCRSKQSARWA